VNTDEWQRRETERWEAQMDRPNPRIAALAEALHRLNVTDGYYETDEEAAAAILAALPPDWCAPVGYVAVRLYSGGVLWDGTTNTEPIDFLNPPSPTPADDPRIAALAEALLKAIPGYQRWMAYPIDSHAELQNRAGAMEAEAASHAAAILAALPPDWCGHEWMQDSTTALLERDTAITNLNAALNSESMERADAEREIARLRGEVMIYKPFYDAVVSQGATLRRTLRCAGGEAVNKPLGDGWWLCPCCDGDGGSNSGPLPDHEAELARLRANIETIIEETNNAADVRDAELARLRKIKEVARAVTRPYVTRYEQAEAINALRAMLEEKS